MLLHFCASDLLTWTAKSKTAPVTARITRATVEPMAPGLILFLLALITWTVGESSMALNCVDGGPLTFFTTETLSKGRVQGGKLGPMWKLFPQIQRLRIVRNCSGIRPIKWLSSMFRSMEALPDI